VKSATLIKDDLLNTETTSTDVLYGLDDRPPPVRSVVLALQHVLTMFGSTVAVPLMLGPPMGMDTGQIAVLISSVMLCSGVATLIQATFGSRLPIIQGVSFSFLAAFFMIIAAVHPEGSDAEAGAAMPYIAGAVMVGACLEMVVGFSGAMAWLRRVLSPVVVGPVIMLIGLALYEAGAPIAASHWPVAILTMALIAVFSFVLSTKHVVFRMFPMLLAIVVAVTVCGLGAAAGLFGPDHPSRPNLSAFTSAPWIRTTDIVFPWGLPKFDTSFIIAVMAGYLASMIESFGDYHACKQMAGAGDPTEQEISRGLGCEGLACALTGVLGGFSSTSYSENVGLIGLTRVGSRFVVQVGAVLLILLGLFGKFGALAAAIPTPVVGGLYCAMFGLISAVGIRQFARADLASDRNLFIGGFALFMGISVQHYFKNGGADDAAQALPSVIASVVSALGQTGMAVAAVLGILLDNLIPGTDAERGLQTESPQPTNSPPPSGASTP
ncbi:MAG: solute carrier family 23 protein, partial [Planctomycetota bacterium]